MSPRQTASSKPAHGLDGRSRTSHIATGSISHDHSFVTNVPNFPFGQSCTGWRWGVRSLSLTSWMVDVGRVVFQVSVPSQDQYSSKGSAIAMRPLNLPSMYDLLVYDFLLAAFPASLVFNQSEVQLLTIVPTMTLSDPELALVFS